MVFTQSFLELQLHLHRFKPRVDTLLVVGVIDRKHGYSVWEGVEPGDWGAADAGGGGVGIGEGWVGFFEGGELGEEGVELGVG